MFRSIFNSLSICLQGTLFSRKPIHKCKIDPWTASDIEADEHPYLLVNPDYAVKHDLGSKMNGMDSRLASRRTQVKTGKARWCPNSAEQHYENPNNATSMVPEIEVYWKSLGLSQAQETTLEAELDW